MEFHLICLSDQTIGTPRRFLRKVIFRKDGNGRVVAIAGQIHLFYVPDRPIYLRAVPGKTASGGGTEIN